MRELSLGLVRPSEIIWVLLKEMRVGLVNGLVLGALLGLIAFAWQGNPWLGLVIGGALGVNTPGVGDARRHAAAAAQATAAGPGAGLKPFVDNGNGYVRLFFRAQLRRRRAPPN